MKEIIYIIGSARSGTTLLDIILGNQGNYFSAGELNRFPKRNGIPPGRDESERNYLFWTTLKKKMELKFDLQELYKTTNKYEYHSGIIRKLNRSSPNYLHYQNYVSSFFTFLNENVDDKYIIDSSKYPMRALHLASLLSEFKYCIYLKRHPVAVLRSFQKKDIEQPSKHWLFVNIYLIWVHTLASFVIKKLKCKGIKVVSIKYEELVNRPLEALSKIESSLELPLNEVKNKINNGEPLVPGNLFDGNRLRLKDHIKLKPSHISKEKWSWKDHIVYLCNLFWWKK